MSEEFKATGSRAPEHPGFMVTHKPIRPWQYRLLNYGGGMVYAEFKCILDACDRPIICRMNADGSETIGAVVCPTCGRKAYARFNDRWFECG